MTIIQIIRFLRDLARKVATLRQPVGGGRAASAGEGALVVTTTVPLGYDIIGPMPEGIPVFMTWGTAGGVTPSVAIFDTPLGYVTSAGTRYVWAKIGLSETAVMLATSLGFVTDTSPTAYATGNFNEDGTPPEFMYVPLGSFTATAAGGGLVVTTNNAGAGSIVVAMHIYNATIQPSGELSFLRMLSFWRTSHA